MCRSKRSLRNQVFPIAWHSYYMWIQLEVTLLGVGIDYLLNFNDHISEICKKKKKKKKKKNTTKQLVVLKPLGRFFD